MKLNLDYYNGKDLYSDGDIEKEMLQMVKSGKNPDDIVREDSRWPILYHFSFIRENILNWYDFREDSNLLEIGAGCGALTGLFCSRCKNVTAVELSKQRAEITAERNKNRDNLEIIVGNLNDIKLDKKFDYITLIGVLEYAKSFTNSNSPYIDFLKNIKNLLSDNGILLVAIENKFGLKYWAGASEDHTGRLFDSIEGYPNGSVAKTFGKYELESIIHEVGFRNTYFYYPFPDYKFPNIIYSDKYLPWEENLLENFAHYDADRYVFFDETRSFKEIIRNKEFPFFSNSYLVETLL